MDILLVLKWTQNHDPGAMFPIEWHIHFPWPWGSRILRHWGCYRVQGLLSHLWPARKRSLGQGNVFTPVFQSFVGFPACIIGHMTRGVCIRGICIRGVCIGGRGRHPRALQDMVNKRAVRILLECSLVYLLWKGIPSLVNFISWMRCMFSVTSLTTGWNNWQATIGT